MARHGSTVTLVLLLCFGCAAPPPAHESPEHRAALQALGQAGISTREGRYAEATEALVALWEESARPPFPRPLYYGNLLKPISDLAKADAQARERLIVVEREQLARVLAGSNAEARPWLDLNRALADEEALVEYAKVALDDKYKRERLEYHELRAFDRLIAVGQWELAGRMYEDPVGRLYGRRTPGVLVPLEMVGKAGAALLNAPLYVLGAGMVSSPGSGPRSRRALPAPQSRRRQRTST
jgi:hypothetical protein